MTEKLSCAHDADGNAIVTHADAETVLIFKKGSREPVSVWKGALDAEYVSKAHHSGNQLRETNGTFRQSMFRRAQPKGHPLPGLKYFGEQGIR